MYFLALANFWQDFFNEVCIKLLFISLHTSTSSLYTQSASLTLSLTSVFLSSAIPISFCPASSILIIPPYLHFIVEISNNAGYSPTFTSVFFSHCPNNSGLHIPIARHFLNGKIFLSFIFACFPPLKVILF